MIILGDVGVCWDGGISDKTIRDRLQNLPCTVLWLDGNQENFDLLEEYPVTQNWNGGKVQFIEEDIIHLIFSQFHNIVHQTTM